MILLSSNEGVLKDLNTETTHSQPLPVYLDQLSDLVFHYWNVLRRNIMKMPGIGVLDQA